MTDETRPEPTGTENAGAPESAGAAENSTPTENVAASESPVAAPETATAIVTVPDEASPPEQTKKLHQTVEIHDAGPCKKHIKITVDHKDISTRRGEKFSELVNDANVAGFRPGK